jgi:hypothetical protein
MGWGGGGRLETEIVLSFSRKCETSAEFGKFDVMLRNCVFVKIMHIERKNYLAKILAENYKHLMSRIYFHECLIYISVNFCHFCLKLKEKVEKLVWSS